MYSSGQASGYALSNNFSFAQTSPDLTVLGLSPLTVDAGVSTSYGATLKNLGLTAISTTFYAAAFIDGSATPDYDDYTSSLSAGGTINFPFTHTFMTAGQHTISIFADSNYAIIESNEANNWFNTSVTVNTPSGDDTPATANTMGIVEVTCLTACTAVPEVTITSTFRCTNSRAISAKRSLRPPAHLYSMATVRPSTQPSSRSLPSNAKVHWLHAERDAGPRKPIVFSGDCDHAICGHAAAAPPSSVTTPRRFK